MVTAAANRFVLTSDVGGTFTDTVLVDRQTGRTWSSKVPSRHRRQEEAVRDGVKETLRRFVDEVDAGAVEGVSAAEVGRLGPFALHHGSTVATNALLERRGAVTAFVTNAGFEDLLEIRRQDRVDLYDLGRTRPEPLVPRALRFGLPFRRGPRGEAWGDDAASTKDALSHVGASCRDAGVGAIAVGFLHADLFPDDEAYVVAALREALPGVDVVSSHAVWPEMREVERFETTVLNAYLAPLMGPYLDRLETSLSVAAAPVGGIADVRILDSTGTLASVAEAARLPASLLVSGPAGGVRASAGLASALGLDPVVSFDVGGTSTDVSFVGGGVPSLSSESRVGGFACRFPGVDVHTLGAGGGSVLWRDAGGHLQVGPHSQGAYPGPACYGRGGDMPTLTDALLLAGRLPPGVVFGGRTRPQRAPAFRTLERLAGALRQSLEATVVGAIRLAVAMTAGGVHVVTTQCGHDPREAALCAFGGAGPLLGAELADALAMRTVVVPWDAGTFCARGMAGSPVVRRRARGLSMVVAAGDAGTPLASSWDDVAGRLDPDSGSLLEGRVALRYAGQSHELEVAASRDVDAGTLRSRFAEAHHLTFGHAYSARDVELVRLVVEHVTPASDPGWRRASDGGLERPEGLVEEHAVWTADGDGVTERTARVVWRGELAPGAELPGPAVVPDATATTYVPPGWRVRVDDVTGALLLSRAEAVA